MVASLDSAPTDAAWTPAGPLEGVVSLSGLPEGWATTADQRRPGAAVVEAVVALDAVDPAAEGVA